MQEYFLPIILIILSGFVFLQNKKPIEERSIIFDNPWGPLIYIPTGLIGSYLLFKIGLKELIIGYFVSLFIAGILSVVFCKKKKNKLEEFFDELDKKLFPGGKKQRDIETKEIMKLSNGKLNFDESFAVLTATSALFSVEEDKSEGRMIEYVNKKTNQKLNNEEAKAILNFITSKFYRNNKALSGRTIIEITKEILQKTSILNDRLKGSVLEKLKLSDLSDIEIMSLPEASVIAIVDWYYCNKLNGLDERENFKKIIEIRKGFQELNDKYEEIRKLDQILEKQPQSLIEFIEATVKAEHNISLYSWGIEQLILEYKKIRKVE